MTFKALLGPAMLALIGCDSPLGSEAACKNAMSYTIGASVSGEIDDKDCRDSQGRVADYYQFTLSSQTNFQLTMQASGFDAELGLYAGQASSAQGKLVFEVVGSGTVGATAFLPPGSYYIMAGTATNQGGGYTLNSPAPAATGCSPYFYYTLPGATIAGSVTANDCAGAGTARQDAIGLWMASGQTVNVSATLDKVGAVLWRVGDGNTASLVTRNLTQAGTVQFSFTAPRADAYRVHLNGEPNAVGTINYTVSIQ